MYLYHYRIVGLSIIVLLIYLESIHLSTASKVHLYVRAMWIPPTTANRIISGLYESACVVTRYLVSFRTAMQDFLELYS